MKRILSVTVHREIDTDPDLSWIGEYSDHPGLYAIDRKKQGDWSLHQFAYFNPGSVEEYDSSATWIPARVKNRWRYHHRQMLKQARQDYERMEDYNNQGWCMMGVWASASIVLTDVCQTIQSGGLWGIESDSGEDYFEEHEGAELSSLRTQLKAVGFTDTEIDTAFASAKHAA